MMVLLFLCAFSLLIQFNTELFQEVERYAQLATREKQIRHATQQVHTTLLQQWIAEGKALSSGYQLMQHFDVRYSLLSLQNPKRVFLRQHPELPSIDCPSDTSPTSFPENFPKYSYLPPLSAQRNCKALPATHPPKVKILGNLSLAQPTGLPDGALWVIEGAFMGEHTIRGSGGSFTLTSFGDFYAQSIECDQSTEITILSLTGSIVVAESSGPCIFAVQAFHEHQIAGHTLDLQESDLLEDTFLFGITPER